MVGAGLAGSEAAWQAAERGARVRLYEMRPGRATPAHRTGDCAELVCSNSLRGAALTNAVGVLKEELRRLGSLIMAAADAHAVPAGGALAVDREAFARHVTRALASHPRIELRRDVVAVVPAGPAIIATGPLTAPELATAVAALLGERSLAFYDAAAPIVAGGSVDRTIAYRASRYGHGDDDAYLNCPFDRERYLAFWEALGGAEQAEREPFDPVPFFEGCLPVEEMARRGPDTLRFGPCKPVGLPDPRTGRPPYAVVQLRPENAAGTLYNLVGFQTSLRFSEQRRVFRLIPGLEAAEFERYGVMHKNMFLCSPRCLEPTLQARRRPDLWFAGQMTGVEGYVESAATGLVAGIGAAVLLQGGIPSAPPPESVIGSLCHYVAGANPDHFQPMNAAFGLLPPLPDGERAARRGRRSLRDARRLQMAERALAAAAAWARRAGRPVAAGGAGS